MTNTSLLKQRIADSGLKIVFIARRLNLSGQGFYNKVNNKPGCAFTAPEIATLADLLKLSMKDIQTIFFCPKGL